MNKYFKLASILSSGLLMALLYSRYFWLIMGSAVNGLLLPLFGLLYWFVVLSIVVITIYTIRDFKERKSNLLIVLSLNIISLSICWIDYDFIEKSKSRPSLIADYSRSKDDGLRLILREDSSFEIFQTSNMLSSHSFNYGNFLINNDTIYLHYRKEMSWGNLKIKISEN